MDVLALLVCGVGVLGLDPEGVGTKVVTLRLQEVGREVLGAVSVVEAERSAESRSGDTPEGTLGDDAVAMSAPCSLSLSSENHLLSPSSLSLVDGLAEELVEEQVLEVGVLAVAERSQFTVPEAVVLSMLTP